ncbi:MAG TPA: type II toxin-antitoxin system RelE/ParE family toxin [Rhizomicrobium sp.]|nr:type II toxin-antitoxin system RelE/ParE family toxin [Rhizomicrobium sp.]
MILVKRLTVRFYRTPSGAEPVREWLWSLDERKEIGDVLRAIEFGWPIGMPMCRPLGKGLYEARISLRNCIARIFFVPQDDRMVLLHAFIKKTQKTPVADMELARTRQREWERRT